MKYFKFESPTNDAKEENPSIFKRMLYKALDFMINAIGDGYEEEKFNLVKTWYIEYEEETQSTCREIGVDTNGDVQVKAPFNGVYGYWVDADLTLEDYRKFGMTSVDFKTFQQIWFSSVIQGEIKELPREPTERENNLIKYLIAKAGLSQFYSSCMLKVASIDEGHTGSLRIYNNLQAGSVILPLTIVAECRFLDTDGGNVHSALLTDNIGRICGVGIYKDGLSERLNKIPPSEYFDKTDIVQDI